MISCIFEIFLKKIIHTNTIILKIVIEFFSIFLTIGVVYYASESYGFKQSELGASNIPLFVFLLVGEVALLLPMGFSERIITHFLEIKNLQFYQTLLGLKISPLRFVLTRAGVDSIFPLARLIIILSFCYFFLDFRFSALSLLLFCFLQILGMLIFALMAMIALNIYLQFNRGIGLFYSIQSIATIAGGAYFPVTVFPKFLKSISGYIPQTHILSMSRAILHRSVVEAESFAVLFIWILILGGIWYITDNYLKNRLKAAGRFF